MDDQFFSLPLVASIPDQDIAISFDGAFYSIRVFYATTTHLWWLELSSVDTTVTLSQILLRPNVMHGLSGKMPGYAGNALIGMVRNRSNGVYGSIDAFAGDFGLYMADSVTV
ncbi:hypothetical protein FH968_17660 [Buttiauxella sp. B2]|uniref:phage baseplate plug family protein n=1 Tax=Buttiauxella sp. B2 TaxID=2587812 RepID=UPI0011246106|nr:hypothetical protein [Buttiauxella sp. B2]TNV17884.1 hypothetical protein FH968_17660 [Buttiauxella sp. B2]